MEVQSVLIVTAALAAEASLSKWSFILYVH